MKNTKTGIDTELAAAEIKENFDKGARRVAEFFAKRPGPIAEGHPEAICDDCGGANVLWFAPSPIWNKVCRPEGEPDGGDPMLCPRCFILRAEAAGIHEVWTVSSESKELKSDAVERVPTGK